jgi:hypothetical protein
MIYILKKQIIDQILSHNFNFESITSPEYFLDIFVAQYWRLTSRKCNDKKKNSSKIKNILYCAERISNGGSLELKNIELVNEYGVEKVILTFTGFAPISHRFGCHFSYRVFEPKICIVQNAYEMVAP